MTEEEKCSVKEHEKQPVWLIDQLRIREFPVDTPTGAAAILKILVKSLSEYNEKQVDPAKRIQDVKTLEKHIEAFEEQYLESPYIQEKTRCLFNLVGQFDPELQTKFQELWDKHQAQPTSPNNFFRQERRTLSRYQPLLQNYLSLLWVIKEKTETSDNPYFKLIEQAYMKYIAQACQAIFAEQPHSCSVPTNSIKPV